MPGAPDLLSSFSIRKGSQFEYKDKKSRQGEAMQMRSAVSLLVSSIALIVVSTNGCRGDDSAPATSHLQFRGGDVAGNFARVISALTDQGILKFYPILVDGQKTPATMLRDSGKFPSDLVTSDVERVLCGLNAHVCKLDASGVAKWNDYPPSKSVLDTLGPPTPELAKCPDEKLPRYVICLPAMDVRDITLPRWITQNEQSKPLDQRVKLFQGCNEYDYDCRARIGWENRAQPYQVDALIGQIKVPTRVLDVTLENSSENSTPHTTELIDQVLDQAGFPLGNPYVYIITPTGAPRPNAGPIKNVRYDREPISDSFDALQKMHFYDGTANTTNYLLSLPSVTVGIWDFIADKAHCDLSEPQSFGWVDEDLTAKRPLPPTRAVGCDDMRLPGTAAYDHATFIAGIIKAQINGQGIAGINPNATVWDYDLGVKRINSDPSPEDRLRAQNIPKPVVINVSQTFPNEGYRSALATVLIGQTKDGQDGYQSQSVIVAAAGNRETQADVEEWNRGCNVYPACWSSDDRLPATSIISVAALNKDGTDLLKCKDVGGTQADKIWNLCQQPSSEETIITNYGENVDVAAIGVSVSTLYGNSFGAWAGTSVATPYVSGLSSLLYAKFVKENPKLPLPVALDVRDRILFTADIAEGVAKYGVVNFSRALNFVKDQFVFQDVSCVGDDCFRAARLAGSNVSLKIIDSSQNHHEVWLSELRRLTREVDGTTWRIIWHLDAIHAARFSQVCECGGRCSLPIKTHSFLSCRNRIRSELYIFPKLKISPRARSGALNDKRVCLPVCSVNRYFMA